MSGHSHSKTIKHDKELTDKKRGQMFSKMARLISVAVKEGGPNLETNSKLRLAFEMAKEINMPKENVERAIQRGTGGASEEKLDLVLFEAYGPGGIAIIIEGITDNKNRTLGEIKQLLSQHNGKLSGEGSVKWMFERKGVLILNPVSQESQNKEALELILIEAGAEDIKQRGNVLEVYTKPEELERVRTRIEEKSLKVESASLEWVPKEEITLNEQDKTASQKLFEALDENDDVQGIYSNLKA